MKRLAESQTPMTRKLAIENIKTTINYSRRLSLKDVEQFPLSAFARTRQGWTPNVVDGTPSYTYSSLGRKTLSAKQIQVQN